MKSFIVFVLCFVLLEGTFAVVSQSILLSSSIFLTAWSNYIIGTVRYIRKCSPITQIYTPLRAASCGFRSVGFAVKTSVLVGTTFRESSKVFDDVNLDLILEAVAAKFNQEFEQSRMEKQGKVVSVFNVADNKVLVFGLTFYEQNKDVRHKIMTRSNWRLLQHENTIKGETD